MNDWIKTDWCCPFCGGYLDIKTGRKITLDARCKKCGRYFTSIVDFKASFSINRIRRRDKIRCTEREQFV